MSLTKLTASAIKAKKALGEKLVVLTAYDVTFARLCDGAGIDIILVGDSVGMVVQGHSSTIAVTLDDMIYHARAVVRGTARAHVVVDMPFMSYQVSVEDGLRAAGRLMKETGAESVKLEGGVQMAPLVARLVSIGIPVMGHIGLQPQSVHQLGGFKIQGRDEAARQQIVADAKALAQAGAYSLILEAIPAPLGVAVTAAVPIPTIGIGAGPGCDGQVLVMHDLLGLDPAWQPRFVRRYADLGREVSHAFAQYADDVRAGKFPADSESYE